MDMTIANSGSICMQTKPIYKYLESITWISKAPRIWNIEVTHSLSSIYAVHWLRHEFCEKKVLYDYVINFSADVRREHW